MTIASGWCAAIAAPICLNAVKTALRWSSRAWAARLTTSPACEQAYAPTISMLFHLDGRCFGLGQHLVRQHVGILLARAQYGGVAAAELFAQLAPTDQRVVGAEELLRRRA